MSITIQNIEESLSLSYVGAVVAKSGYSFDAVSKDYGVDVAVRNVKKFDSQIIDLGVAFDCQLKASINWSEDEDTISYPMKIDAYNRLVIRNSNSLTPCYLILMCLPKDENLWIDVQSDQFLIRKCCYYILLKGEKSENKSNITIKIPKINILNPEAIAIIGNNALRKGDLL